MKFNKITREIMDQVYEKNSWLYWAVQKSGHKKHNLCGHLHKTGYYVVKIDGKLYKNHRILYQLYHNIILEPDQQIDHINRIKTDNRKENLKLATHDENMMNRKTFKNNISTGHKNISFRKQYNCYILRIQKNKNRYIKSFNKNEYTLEDVIKIRDIELEKLHGSFASFG